MTYAELVAMRDSGEMTNLDYARAMRAEHRSAYYGASAYRDSLSKARRHAQKIQGFARTQARYSTAQLEQDATGTNGDVAQRYAVELLKLDTVAERLAAWADAHRFMNATPDAGRPSDALRSGVRAILAARVAA